MRPVLTPWGGSGGCAHAKLGETALRLWNSLGDAVDVNYKYEDLQGWWTEDDCFVISHRTAGVVSFHCSDSPDGDCGAVLRSMGEVAGRVLDRRRALIRGREEVGTSRRRAQSTDSARSGSLMQHGWLKKKRNKFPAVLQDRYFALVADGDAYALKYWVTEPDGDEDPPIGVIDMSRVESISVCQRDVLLQAFQSNKQRSRPYLLRAKTISDRDRWHAALQEAHRTAPEPGDGVRSFDEEDR